MIYINRSLKSFASKYDRIIYPTKHYIPTKKNWKKTI